LARANATRLALTIRVCQGSWFEPVSGERFELIVSNPPYIDAQDPHLSEGDVRFEPRSALVADAAGLADLAHIVTWAPEHLTAGGWLLLEHGWQQGSAVRELLCQRGFQAVTTVRDYGSQERVTLGQWEGIA
jgi:release factor glutamine methyltransferase